MNNIIQKEFSDLVIDLAFVVHKVLGPGHAGNVFIYNSFQFKVMEELP